MEKREFKVGDKIVIMNWYGTHTIQVTKVTKLHAVCEVKRADGTGYVQKFKKEYIVDGNYYGVTLVPRINFDTNKYKVISE